jgi:hypothetical protein
LEELWPRIAKVSPPAANGADKQTARLRAWEQLDKEVAWLSRLRSFGPGEPVRIIADTSETRVDLAINAQGARVLLAAGVRSALGRLRLLPALAEFLLSAKVEEEVAPGLTDRLLGRAVAFTSACLRFPAMRVGPIVEPTACAAVMRLSTLLVDQVPTHFGFGDFLEEVTCVADHLGLGVCEFSIANLITLCLLPAGPWHKGLDPAAIWAIRLGAAELRFGALCDWIAGAFLGWDGEACRVRIRQEYACYRRRSAKVRAHRQGVDRAEATLQRGGGPLRQEASVAESSTDRPARANRRRGRPTDTDPEADKRIWEGWRTMSYKTYEELGRTLGMTGRQVRVAIDRHRQRIKRGRREASDE